MPAAPSRPLLVYVAVVAVLGVAAAAYAAVWLPTAAPGSLTLLLGIGAALTASRTIPFPGTGVRLNADTPFLLGLVLVGASREAVLLSGLGMAMATWRSSGGNPKPHAAMLNFGAGYLGGLGGVGVHALLSAVPEPVPAFAAAIAIFAINSVLVAVAIRLATGKLPGEPWRDGLRVTLLGYLASASIAWILAAVPHGFSIGLLAAPLAAVVWEAYRSHRDKAEEQQRRTHDREVVFLPTLEAICTAIEARDPQTHGHNQRVQALSLDLAHALGVTDPEALTGLRIGALLHDIGKLAIPDALLHARRELGAEELMRCRQHAAFGSELVRHVPFPMGVLSIVRHHHERWDGEGYPDRLAGEKIPFLARIVAIIEAYDDMRTSVSYRPMVPEVEALRRVEREAGTAFDPAIALVFVRMMRERAAPVAEPHAQATAAIAAIAATSMEQARASGLAYADEVTGLGNARALTRDLERSTGRLVGVLMLDLDGFKGINDTYGHAVGDLALRAVGVALQGLQDARRTAYRNGGDEFIVLLREPGALDAEVAVARGCLEALDIPVAPGTVAPIRVSIGAAIGEPGPDLLRDADRAMYAEKAVRKANKPRGAAPEVREVS